MCAVAAESELFRSCEILFGLELNVTRDFLEYLQLTGIKSAYRQKARETHPDLAAGKSEQEKKALAQVFQSVQEAYENLKAYLDARERGYRIGGRTVHDTAPRYYARPNDTRRTAHEKARAEGSDAFSRARQRYYDAKAGHGKYQQGHRRAMETEKLYRGPVPGRKLLFGHYLYYCGAINWRSVIQALVWQRMQRPRIGELGKKIGWLNEQDIRRIMEYRTPFQPFGECAVKLGILTEQQRSVLVFQQKRLQKKIGCYFVENRIISQPLLERLLERHRSHNASTQKGGSASWYTF